MLTGAQTEISTTGDNLKGLRHGILSYFGHGRKLPLN